MDLTTLIQVAAGILFVWIALGMITSQVQDWIASLLTWRATMLEQAVGNLLSNDEFRKNFYQHPIIQGLHTNGGTRKPAGIPADKFALVVLDTVIDVGKNSGEIKSSFENMKQGIENLKGKEGFESISQSLDTLMLGIEHKADAAEASFTEARGRIEGWFDNAMDRLSGAYRRRMQVLALVAGILIAAVLNADSAAIATKLWTDPILRQAVAQAAQNEVNQQTQAGQAPNTQQIISNLQGLSIPLGWSADNVPSIRNADGTENKNYTGNWLMKIGGILITGVAAAQGAPFWFDLMRKLLNR